MISAFDNARIPLIPLDYNQKYLSVKKELMVDYTNGKLYIVSAESKEKIFDVTSQITEIVKNNITANNVIVNIEGIGEIDLKSIIDKLYKDEVNFTVEEDKDFAPSIRVDNSSINVVNGNMQIYKFDQAVEGTCPVKDGTGAIIWKPLPVDESALISATGISSTATIEGSSANIRTFSLSPDGIYIILGIYNDKYIIINPAKPTDNYTKIKAVIYVANKLETESVIDSHKLICTSKSLTDYLASNTNNEVLWDTAPTSANINAPVSIDTGCYYTLTLETYNQGIVWLASLKKFATSYTG